MLFIMLMRWLRGYVRVRVSQGDAGRLMTLCTRNGILFWNGVQDGDAYTGYVAAGLYNNLAALAEKSGLNIQFAGSFGLPQLLYRYRRRAGIFLGILLFFVGLVVSQQFVWSIEVEGNKNVDPQRLIALLQEAGVHRGTLKRNIDLRYVAREILAEADELSWTALNLYGTTAILRIRERTPPLPKIDTNVPANVIALEDGQIKRLQVTDGKPVLKEGETVRKGEVIVSGVWEDQWGLTHFVRAGAKAFAHVPRSLTIKVPLVQEEYQIYDVESRSYLELFHLRLPLFFYQELQGEYKVEQYSEIPELFGVSLPFMIGHEKAVFFERQEVEISQEQAMVIAQRRLELLERQSFGENPVISRNVSASVESGVLIFRGDYEIEMDIAGRQDIALFEFSTPEERKKIPRESGY